MYSNELLKSLLPRLALASLLGACGPLPAVAKAREAGPHHWQGVERVIVIGDLHGDWNHYIQVLRAAGMVDDRDRWAGGETHLVQTGDVPDRGPDTRRILDHLEKLQKEARKKGGMVHTLIGNHEAMNVYGDLRYVSPGEYQAFTGKQSERLRELQWEHHLATLEARDPVAFEAMDKEAFRAQWESEYPLGWVEHRQAWMPQGEYGKRVLEQPVVLKIDDTLFLHGGLSAKYCQLDLGQITEQVHAGIANFNPENPGIAEDSFGPLWYRGLAQDPEAQRSAMVDAILERYGARRMVLGHTPTQGVVWPRFDGRVILNDVGISAYYGGYVAFLEIGAGGLVAHYGVKSLPLPENNDGRLAYLKQVVALNPANGHLQSRLQRMLAQQQRGPAPAEADAGNGAENGQGGSETEAPPADPEAAQVEAWLSPDNCR